MKLNYYLLLFIGIVFLSACSNTPNNVNMTFTQGQCVQANMYQQVGLTPPSAIINNPATAPYCTSVTLQNNNSGVNANNVQIVGSAFFNISYSANGKNYSSVMYDPTAARITVGNANQYIGNIGVYDPNNCVTPQGANIVTLNAGGNSCQFFLQLTGESFPVGVYPITLNYNYTNGNQNYAITATLNQRVYLYGGADSGLFYMPTNLSTNVTNAAWQSGIDPSRANTPYVTANVTGTIYYASARKVFNYIGVSGNRATQVGGDLPTNVISIAFDNQSNPYIATESGVYVYNKLAATPAWVLLANNLVTINTKLNGLVSTITANSSTILYATTESNAYSCTNPSVTANGVSCSWSILPTGGITDPSTFYQNSLDTDTFGNIYAGTNQRASLYNINNNQWTAPYNLNTTGQIYGVNFLQNQSNSALSTLYLGQINGGSSNPSVYSCNTSFQCSSLVSSKNNPLTGNTYSISNDGANNLCITGSNLTTADFGAGTLVTGICYMNPATWVPIANGGLNINKIQSSIISSMLTTY